MSDDAIGDILTGVAELLALAGVGAWNPSGAVVSETVATIGLRGTPPNAPLSITLSDYPLDRNARLTDTIVGVNLRIRGDRRPATAATIAHKAWLTLHALGRTTLGTAPNQVTIVDMTWNSEVPLGPDQNGRYERSVNYWLRVNLAHPRLG